MIFVDTLLAKKDDGTIKVLVYRKKTHTDQYLNFRSHHPLHQKLGIVRTLLNRCDTIVTEEQDKKKEQKHIHSAMKTCGYPDWALQKVNKEKKHQRKTKNERKGCHPLYPRPF